MSAQEQHDAQDDEAGEGDASTDHRNEIPEGHSGRSSSYAALPPSAQCLEPLPAIHKVRMLGTFLGCQLAFLPTGSSGAMGVVAGRRGPLDPAPERQKPRLRRRGFCRTGEELGS